MTILIGHLISLSHKPENKSCEWGKNFEKKQKYLWHKSSFSMVTPTDYHLITTAVESHSACLFVCDSDILISRICLKLKPLHATSLSVCFAA